MATDLRLVWRLWQRGVGLPGIAKRTGLKLRDVRRAIRRVDGLMAEAEREQQLEDEAERCLVAPAYYITTGPTSDDGIPLIVHHDKHGDQPTGEQAHTLPNGRVDPDFLAARRAR